MNKLTETEKDFDSIPDEIYLSPDHEGLLPELKPIRTNTFSNRKSASVKDRLMLLGVMSAVCGNFGPALGSRADETLTYSEKQKRLEEFKAKNAKENKEAQERAIWNKKIEDQRRDKQTRKLLRKINSTNGQSSARAQPKSELIFCSDEHISMTDAKDTVNNDDDSFNAKSQL